MDNNMELQQILPPTGPLNDLLQRNFNIRQASFIFTEDALKDISNLLSIETKDIVLVGRDGKITLDTKHTYDAIEDSPVRVVVLPEVQLDEGLSQETLKSYGVNQLNLLDIKCSQQKSITFNYTTETTFLDLKDHIEKEFKIPKEMQLIYRKSIVIGECGNIGYYHMCYKVHNTTNIIDNLLVDTDGIELHYDYLFAVRLPAESKNEFRQLARDKISRACIENEFTILKTITVHFINGKKLCVINISNNIIKTMVDVEDYITKNLYKGKFFLYLENTKECLIEDKMYENIEKYFIDKSTKFVCYNLNLMFVPDFTNSDKDVAFLELHKANLTQEIHLMFITKEEIITVNQLLTVNGLRNKIKEQFNYALYQQRLFYNKRELSYYEFLTELSMEQKGDLAIKVVVSKARTVDIEVTCCFQYQKDKYMFTLNDVEDNLLVKDVRKMIQDRIQHQGPIVIKQVHPEENHIEDKQMICDIHAVYGGETSNRLARLTIYKVFTITFHEKYKRFHTNTEPEDEVYVVYHTSETVQMMLNSFERRELKQYKLDSTMNKLSVTGKKIEKKTLLVSLDSGSTIHVKDKQL